MIKMSYQIRLYQYIIIVLFMININLYATECIIDIPAKDKGRIINIENKDSYIIVKNKYKVYKHIQYRGECSIYKNSTYSYDVCDIEGDLIQIWITNKYGLKQRARCDFEEW